MEYLIGLIAALIGGIFFYKKKADKNAIDAKLAETKGKDSALIDEAKEVRLAIEEIDKNLKKIKEEREVERKKRKYMTLKERAELAKKKFQK